LRYIQIIFLLRLEAQCTQVIALPTICSFIFECDTFQAPQAHIRNVRTAEIGVQTSCEGKCWKVKLQKEILCNPRAALPVVPVLCTRREMLSCLG
jgi:hypothetical protein